MGRVPPRHGHNGCSGSRYNRYTLCGALEKEMTTAKYRAVITAPVFPGSVDTQQFYAEVFEDTNALGQPFYWGTLTDKHHNAKAASFVSLPAPHIVISEMMASIIGPIGCYSVQWEHLPPGLFDEMQEQDLRDAEEAWARSMPPPMQS